MLCRARPAPAADLRHLDLRLLPYIQFSDGVLAEGEPDLDLAKRIGIGERRLPGHGRLPLAVLLEVVSDDLPMSIEVPRPVGASMTDAAWARTLIEETRRFIRASHGIEAE